MKDEKKDFKGDNLLKLVPIPEDVTGASALNSTDTDSAFAGNDFEGAHIYYGTNVTVNSARLVNAFGFNKDSDLIRVMRKAISLYYNETDPVVTEQALIDFHKYLGLGAHLYGGMLCLWRKQSSRNYVDNKNRPLNYLLNANVEEDRLRFSIEPEHINAASGSAKITNDEWSNAILSKLQHIYISERAAQIMQFLFGNIHHLRNDDETIRLMMFNEAQFRIEENLVKEDAIQWSSRTKDNCLQWFDDITTEIDKLVAKYPYFEAVAEAINCKRGSNLDFDLTRDLAGQTIHIYRDNNGALEAAIYAIGGSDDTVATALQADWDYGFVFNPKKYGIEEAFLQSIPGLSTVNAGISALMTTDGAVIADVMKFRVIDLVNLLRFSAVCDGCVSMTNEYDGEKYVNYVYGHSPKYLFCMSDLNNNQDYRDIGLSNWLNSVAHAVQDNKAIKFNAVYSGPLGRREIDQTADWDYMIMAGTLDYIIDKGTILTTVANACFSMFYVDLSLEKTNFTTTEK